MVVLAMLVAVLALLSLAIKQQRLDFAAELDDDRLARDVAADLARAGYVTTVVAGKYYPTMVSARRGDCHVMLRDASVHGHSLLAVYRRTLGHAGPVRFVYAGQWQAGYPTLRAELAWRIQRELGRIGIDVPIRPVLAVADSEECRPAGSLFAGARVILR
jgi:hypothetical protein